MMKAGSKWQLFIRPTWATAPWAPVQELPQQRVALRRRTGGHRTGRAGSQPGHERARNQRHHQVPSAEEMKKGAKIEVIKKEDVDKLKQRREEVDASFERTSAPLLGWPGTPAGVSIMPPVTQAA